MPLLKTSGTLVLILIELGVFRVFWIVVLPITYTQTLKFPQYPPIKQGFGVVGISLVCTCGVYLIK